jgi:uncharacterized protein
MAELRVDGGELVLHLSAGERAEAIHGDLRVPLSAVRSVQVLEDAHTPADGGFKIGTRFPGIAEVAIIESGSKKIFAAVHHDTPRGVRVCLQGVSYDEWIVGCADPETVVAGLPVPS